MYFLVFLLLFACELLYFKIADHYNIIDKPNERSSHTKITLRGGGIIFYFGALLFFVLSGFQYPYFFAALTLITIITFLDDIFTLSNKIRIVIHFASIFLLFRQVGILTQPIWVIILALIFCVGIINAYNFMDGINGITVSNSIAVLALLGVVNNRVTFVDQNLIVYAGIAALVFGFFNFRQKAKCFAGDVGAVSMAFIILFLLAKLIFVTGNYIYILFLAVYGIDAIWTIVQRLLKKENIFKAHRTHLYQILANENGSNPLLISGLYGLVQLGIGFIVIFLSQYSAQLQMFAAFILLLVGSFAYLQYKNKLRKKYHLK